MKKIFIFLLTSFFTIQYSTFAQDNQNYTIKLNVKSLQDSTCYLAHFYLTPKSQIIKDTAQCDKNGNIVFKGAEPLPKGIYIISIGKSRSVQLVIGSEKEIEMTTDTSYTMAATQVLVSEENKAFYDYQNKMTEFTKEYQAIAEEGSGKVVNKNLDKQRNIQTKIQVYQNAFFEKNKNLVTAKILKAPQQPNIPESPKLANGSIDSTFALRWIQKHYFDNLDLSDEMYIKTPYLENKVDYYLDNLNYQVPDSLNKAADFIVKNAKNTKNMQKYLISHIASRYERPTFMGGDAVFVHMAEKYFIGMPSLWDSSTLAPINEKKIAVKNVLLGKKIQNAQLTDTTGTKIMPLHDVKAKYTLLFLYDPECGHCKERAPKVLAFYEKMKAKDLKVYAASTERDVVKMKKFISSQKTQAFINVYDHLTITDFKQKFNVFTTPQVILLDKDKKIIGRGLEEDQMEDLINKMEKGLIK